MFIATALPKLDTEFGHGWVATILRIDAREARYDPGFDSITWTIEGPHASGTYSVRQEWRHAGLLTRAYGERREVIRVETPDGIAVWARMPWRHFPGRYEFEVGGEERVTWGLFKSLPLPPARFQFDWAIVGWEEVRMSDEPQSAPAEGNPR